jgi:hypothetical protein
MKHGLFHNLEINSHKTIYFASFRREYEEIAGYKGVKKAMPLEVKLISVGLITI